MSVYDLPANATGTAYGQEMYATASKPEGQITEVSYATKVAI
jgi:hypothetical protein